MIAANSGGVNKSVEVPDVMEGQMDHSQVRQSQMKRIDSVMGCSLGSPSAWNSDLVFVSIQQILLERMMPGGVASDIR